MERLIKNVFRYWPVLLSLILVVGALVAYPGIAASVDNTRGQVYAQAQSTSTPTPTLVPPAPGQTSTSLRTIMVSGNGTADVTPDMAVVTLGVTTTGQTASQALTQNNTQMQAVMSALQKAGVASADIQTSFVQLAPRYENPPQQPQTQAQATPQVTPTEVPVTYMATNTVNVKVRKLDTLGTLLDSVVSAGGNQIQGIRFDVSNPSQGTDQARQAAMSDATHKAQQLATLANAKLGTVMTIEESSQQPIPFAAPMAAQAVGGSVPVSPGTQTVTVSLQVTWELQVP